MEVTDPHDLYGLPLEQFTERRNALARELRGEGRRDEASSVSKLRKPSVAAWAVNQLVRTQRREIDALFKAGDRLQRAQADLMATRGDPASLRAALDAERGAIEQLADAARGLLNADGHQLLPARLEQVTETLHAAALDGEARASVREGCLERELRHIGLGGLGRVGTVSGSASRRKPESRDDGASKPKAAREAEAAAARRLERATRELRMAEERRDRVAEELRDAEGAVAAARELAAEAEQEHKRAKQRLDRG